MSNPSTPNPPKRTWHSAAAAAVPGRGSIQPSRRRKTAYLVLAVILALAGGLVAWLLLLGRFHAPHFVTVSVTEYRSPHYPPTSWAERDSRAIAARFTDPRYAFQSQEGHRLLGELDRLEGQSDGPVVVHLAAIALCSGEQVYVLPGHAEPDQEPSWKAIPLSGVLDRMARCPARHKLLILDLMQPLANPRIGILADDVAGAVDAQVRKRESEGTLPFAVLLACSRGQVSHHMERAGRSAFGYYLDEGLSGRADRYNPDRRADGRVSVRELAEFVRERVERWSVETKRLRQTPVLIGGDDFALVQAPQQPSEPQTFAPEAYPQWLSELWLERDRCWGLVSPPSGDDPRPEYPRPWEAPRAFQRFEAWLQRADAIWRAGGDVEKLAGEARTALQTFRDQCKPPLPPPSWHSAAGQEAQLAAKPDDAQRKALADWLRLHEDDTLSPKDKEKLAEAEKTLREKFPQQPRGQVQRVRAVWQTLLDLEPVSQPATWIDRFRRRVAALDVGKPVLPYTEAFLLRRLADLPGRKSEVWAAAMHQAIVTTDAAEALLGVDRRVLALLADDIARADGDRRAGLALIFDKIDRDSAETAATKLTLAKDRYANLLRQAKAMEQGYPLHARAVLLLPHYAAFVGECSDEDSLSLFIEAAGLTGQLGRQLYPLPEPPGGTSSGGTSVAALVNDLGDRLKKLEERLKQNWQVIDPRVWGELDAALATPLPPAEDRNRLRTRLADERGRLHDAVLAQDAAENGGAPRKPVASESSPPATSYALAARKALIAIEIIRLAECPEHESLRTMLSAARDANTPRSWHTLGRRIQNCLGPDLIQRLETADPALVQRWSGLLSPWDQSALDSRDGGSGNSVAAFRLRTDAVVYRWLARRLAEEAKLYPESDALAHEWFRKWRASYEGAARNQP